VRLIIDGVEQNVPGELPDPAAVARLGRDPEKFMLQRIDGRYAGDTKPMGEIFQDGDELTFVARRKPGE
jgi:hypothetical protein